ncbi:unnamed protein product [Clavelina lepadiformis]|uniref:Uncharacterized protein n=1 Tax=Clavelina lepadiformis TaxID=159417 RepID=A0ABP0GQE9_CLALP
MKSKRAYVIIFALFALHQNKVRAQQQESTNGSAEEITEPTPPTEYFLGSNNEDCLCCEDAESCLCKPEVIKTFTDTCPNGCISPEDCVERTCKANATCIKGSVKMKCSCNKSYIGNCELLKAGKDSKICRKRNESKDEEKNQGGCKLQKVGNDSRTCEEKNNGESQGKTKGFCEKVNDWEKKGYDFKKTKVGSTAQSKQKCPRGTPKAVIRCEGTATSTGQFSSTSLVEFECGLNPRSVIDMALGSINSSAQFATYSSYLETITRNASSLSEQDNDQILEFLGNVTKKVKNGLLKISAQSAFKDLAKIASSVISEDHGMKLNRRERLTKNLPTLALHASLDGNEKNFSLETSNFLLYVEDLAESESNDFQFSPQLNDTVAMTTITPFHVVIPSPLVTRVRNSSLENAINGRISFIIYKDDFLFPSNDNVTEVLSIDVGVNVLSDSLNEPIQIEHVTIRARNGISPKPGNKLMDVRTTLECVFWDFNTSRWSTEGCSLNQTAHPPVCLCTHLTNFALLIKSEDVPANRELGIVSDVGCILSIICLIVTIILISVNRDSRKYRASKILLHIYFNLCVSYLVFISGVSRIDNRVGCVVVTAFLHYVWLVTWCWMAIYSFEMYAALVKVFGKYRSGFMVKASAFSYIVPAFAVAVTAGVAVGSDPSFDSYRSSHVCWLKGHALYWGFLLPVGLILLYNLFVFCRVTYELQKQNVETQADNLKRSTSQSLIIAVTMTLTMGITWVFGYMIFLATSEVALTAFSWIFAIISTFQGVLICLLTLWRHSDTRHVLWTSLKNAFSSSYQAKPGTNLQPSSAATLESSAGKTVSRDQEAKTRLVTSSL